jgi:hypothetical protein
LSTFFESDGYNIGIASVDGEDFISLTDLAKYKSDDPNGVVRNWIRSRDTLAFLRTWETLNNPDFSEAGFTEVTEGSGLNSFTLSPQKWVDSVNAKGLMSKPGRGGGTYAHSDIAFEFASWVSPEFKLFVIRDYKRLKAEESQRASLDWNLSRQLAKINYRIHTDSIKKNLIPESITREQAGFVYASEADMLNVVVFGMTAREWRNQNPGVAGNIRDQASINQLLVLMNLENQNATLVANKVPQAQRMQQLRDVAVAQLKSLEGIDVSGNLKKLTE